MLLLGIDVGTSSIKVSVVDPATQQVIASAQYPDEENQIITPQPGWAEQSPDVWWEQVQQAILRCNKSKTYEPAAIAAIGISYQMHGLVLVDKQQQVLRNSIIWCDSRAVEFGEKAFKAIGEEKCLTHLLNSPGNFTAAKLAWVKQNEPHVYDKIDKVMLPGDFIAMRMSGDLTTSISALSEGILFDFLNNKLSDDVTGYFGFERSFFPPVHPVFSQHGLVSASVAAHLGLKAGTPICYKAGDQPNNALSLNVLNPGEVAATAGTSGVIYGVSDQLAYDPQSRVNTFAHVNYQDHQKRLGVLLCINGTGKLYSWMKTLLGGRISYNDMNTLAAQAPPGAEGLRILPFGNGVERILNNRPVGAYIQNVDLNIHGSAHLLRAAHEGIACAFRYGLDIMRENGMKPSVIRAGSANLFLSSLFTETFVNATGIPVELYKNDGSAGAAIGAGIGAGIFSDAAEAFSKIVPIKTIEPDIGNNFEAIYQDWKFTLSKQINQL
jgi:xylulokinase